MTLTPGEYEEFLCLTHAVKFDSTTSVAQIGNASAYLAHSLGPWILDSNASDHLSSQRNRVCLSPPNLPLTFVLYVLDSPFNFISISKLIYDLNCSITLSHSFATLPNQSMERTISIRHESQGLYHLSSTPSSTFCTSTDKPLLVHHSWSSKHFQASEDGVSLFQLIFTRV